MAVSPSMILVFAQIARRNVAANWRHSLAALLSIAAAFIALAVFSGFIDEIETMYTETFEQRNMLGHLLVLPVADDQRAEPLFSHETQQAVVKILKETAAIDFWVPFLPINGTVSNHMINSIFIGFGYDLTAGLKMRAPSWSWNTVAGVPLDQAADGSEAVVLGQSLGFILGCRPLTDETFTTGQGGYAPVDRPFSCISPLLQFNATTAHGRANAAEARVSGLVDAAFKDIDVRYTLMPLAMAQDLWGRDDIGFYALKVAPRENVKAALTQLADRFKAAGVPAMVQSWKDHKFGDFFVKSMKFMNIFRNFIVSIIAVIAGLSIFNIVTRNVQERTRELGTLRSIGYLPWQLTTMFLLENVLLSTVGAAIGAVTSLLLCRGVNSLHITYQSGFLSQPVPLRLGIGPELALATFLLITLLGLVASLIACRKAHHLSIVECLHHV